jgi:hypothetical protein
MAWTDKFTIIDLNQWSYFIWINFSLNTCDFRAKGSEINHLAHRINNLPMRIPTIQHLLIPGSYPPLWGLRHVNWDKIATLKDEKTDTVTCMFATDRTPEKKVSIPMECVIESGKEIVAIFKASGERVGAVLANRSNTIFIINS